MLCLLDKRPKANSNESNNSEINSKRRKQNKDSIASNLLTSYRTINTAKTISQDPKQIFRTNCSALQT